MAKLYSNFFDFCHEENKFSFNREIWPKKIIFYRNGGQTKEFKNKEICFTTQSENERNIFCTDIQ